MGKLQEHKVLERDPKDIMVTILRLTRSKIFAFTIGMKDSGAVYVKNKAIDQVTFGELEFVIHLKNRQGFIMIRYKDVESIDVYRTLHSGITETIDFKGDWT